MNRDQKTAVVEEIAAQIGSAEAVFAVDYRGITVAQVAELRDNLRDAEARFRVVKNSLSERAADQAGAEDLKTMLVGPTALAFVQGDAALAAKALNDVGRRLNRLEFKGGLLNGSVLTADDVRSIARLPSREVLQGLLVGTIASPLTGLVRGLNALIAGVAIQLQAMVDQGLVSGAAASADAAEPAEPQAAAESEAAGEPEAPVAPQAAGEPETPVAPAEPEVPAAPEAPTEPAPTEPEAPVAPVAPAAPAAPAEPEAPVAPTEPEQPQESETEAVSDAASSDDKEEV